MATLEVEPIEAATRHRGTDILGRVEEKHPVTACCLSKHTHEALGYESARACLLW